MPTLKCIYREEFQNTNADVNVLSQKMGLTRRALYDKTMREIGKSPQEYFEELRTDAALPLLLEDKPLALVSVQVGYVQTKTFASAFKRRFGITPGEWKKRNAPPKNHAEMKNKKKMGTSQNDFPKRLPTSGVAPGYQNVVVLRRDSFALPSKQTRIGMSRR